MAYAMEDPSKQFIEFVDGLAVPEVSNFYDITGYRAAHVIAIFKSIVNHRLWKDSSSKRKEFKFEIIKGASKIVFSVKPKTKSSTDHPGNAVVCRKYPQDRRKLIKWSYDAAFVKELNVQYSNDTKRFAQDIKRVFKNNWELFKCRNEIIQDVYILLLFEIGRRLVDEENVPEKDRADKQAYDSLPISGAITTIVKLFEAKECIFEDVFHKKGRFHCFTGTPKERKDAILSMLTLKSKEKVEDIEELFYGEKVTKDTASKGNESSKEDAKVSELSEEFNNLDVSKKVRGTVEED